MTIFTRTIGPAVFAACAALTAQAATAAESSLADAVRMANDRFADVAVAIAEGYGPIPCTSGAEGGAMGIHYVNPALIGDGAIDIARPQAIMYEPGADGSTDAGRRRVHRHQGPGRTRRPSLQLHQRAEPLRPAGRSTSCTSGPGGRTRRAPSPT